MGTSENMIGKYLTFIASLIIIISVLFLIIKGDPYFTLIGILMGVFILLSILAIIFEIFFPESKTSEKLDKSAKWILENLKV